MGDTGNTDHGGQELDLHVNKQFDTEDDAKQFVGNYNKSNYTEYKIAITTRNLCFIYANSEGKETQNVQKKDPDSTIITLIAQPKLICTSPKRRALQT